jgi:hypothetical protein
MFINIPYFGSMMSLYSVSYDGQTKANRTNPEAVFLVVCDPSMNEL